MRPPGTTVPGNLKIPLQFDYKITANSIWCPSLLDYV